MAPGELPGLPAVCATAEVIERIRAAPAARGIVPPAQNIAHGGIHPCAAASKNGMGIPLVYRTYLAKQLAIPAHA